MRIINREAVFEGKLFLWINDSSSDLRCCHKHTFKVYENERSFNQVSHFCVLLAFIMCIHQKSERLPSPDREYKHCLSTSFNYFLTVFQLCKALC